MHLTLCLLFQDPDGLQQLHIEGCRLDGNRAGYGGGAIVLQNIPTVHMIQSQMANNMATVAGGAVNAGYIQELVFDGVLLQVGEEGEKWEEGKMSILTHLPCLGTPTFVCLPCLCLPPACCSQDNTAGQRGWKDPILQGKSYGGALYAQSISQNLVFIGMCLPCGQPSLEAC
jgi:hypothetical protein